MEYGNNSNLEQAQCMSINATINDREYASEGDHTFIITNLEPGMFPGSAKMEKCATMTISMSVHDGVYRVPAKIKLFINRNNEWRLAAFFRCINLMKRHEAYQMDWSKALGQRGKAHFTIREYTDKYGEPRRVSDIDRFYDYNEEFFKDDEAVQFIELSDETELPL